VSRGRSALIGLLCTVLAGFLAHQLFGVPLHWAILFGLATGSIAMLGALLAGMMDANWEAVPNPVTSAPELHASSLAIRFAEAADDHQRFKTRVRPRLCRVALAILRARPGTEDITSLDDPRARAALGPELHAVLTDDRAAMPGPRQLSTMLARLEET
jgi:hypothetical protein